MGNGKPTSKNVSPRTSRLTSYQNSQSRKNYIDIKIAFCARTSILTHIHESVARPKSKAALGGVMRNAFARFTYLTIE